MISLKGTREGLLITLGDGEWPDVLAELAIQLGKPSAADFFRGASVRLETGDRELTSAQLDELEQLFELHEMKFGRPQIPSVSSEYASENDSAPRLNEAEVIEPNGREHVGLIDAAMVRRTIRSGQVIRYAGHIVIYGDVNPGAEIIASGDVLVWGKLRGVVHAGAGGDERAVVGALLLAPTQLRIGSHIARAPDPPRGKKIMRGAEMARVRDDRIVIESWTV